MKIKSIKLLVGVLVVTLLTLGLLRLHFDSDVLDLLPGNIPSVKGLKLYQKHFTNSRELIITLSGGDKDVTEEGARKVAETLGAQPNLVSEVTWQAPWLQHPELASEMIAYLWINQPPEVFAAFVNRLAVTNLPNLLAETQTKLATTLSPADIAQLSYDPLGFTQLPDELKKSASSFGDGSGLFSSSDGLFRVIFVKSAVKLDDYRECIRWMEKIREVVNESIKPIPTTKEQLNIGYTGSPAFVAEISTSMRRDMIQSIFGTSLIIAILFWIAHRRILPMLWLMFLLAVILGSTMLLGGLIYGTINLISLGFAGILLGLAVDYAVVHYQEALAHKELSIPQVRSAITPSIFWAALTTVTAFLTLNFGGLPGLGQLGGLVALGVCLSAVVMIFAYLPPLFRERMKPGFSEHISSCDSTKPSTPLTFVRMRWIITALILVGGCLWFAIKGLPEIDATASALQPRNSAAYQALEKVKRNLLQKSDPDWLLVTGNNEQEISKKLLRIKPILEAAVASKLIENFTLPGSIWPSSTNQVSNLNFAKSLVDAKSTLSNAVITSGFTKDATSLQEAILAEWAQAAHRPQPWWPTNQLSQWVLGKLAIHETNTLIAAAYIYPAEGDLSARSESMRKLESLLPKDDAILSGWELLGSRLLEVVQAHLWQMVLPMLALIFISLWLAFRGWREMFISLATLVLSGIILLMVMRVMGWTWNLLNLMSIPLILGTGVDYGIFMQLALRRHHGDQREVFNSVGKALLLCGGTAVCGFASLGFSSNVGMSSLGQICSVGIGANVFCAVFLLPAWWSGFAGNFSDVRATTPDAPSSLYSGLIWKLAGKSTHLLPKALTRLIASFSGNIYCLLASHRRKVVIKNLLPACKNDPSLAAHTTKQLFRNFATKVVDLLDFETSTKPPEFLVAWSGLEGYEKAEARKAGVLLVTIHLGNWELGGAYLAQRGKKILVLTQPEPDANLTEMRKASRKSHGIETMVIGSDPFAFVEIIKQLQDGATVALLMDRTVKSKSVMVELFGRPFEASIAVAELARATGSAVIPSYIVRSGGGYEAHFLPEVVYDRAALNNRETRTHFTQRILRAFEPAIQQYTSQWYHFVPVWPKLTEQ